MQYRHRAHCRFMHADRKFSRLDGGCDGGGGHRIVHSECSSAPIVLWGGFGVLTHLGDWLVLCRFGMKLGVKKYFDCCWPLSRLSLGALESCGLVSFGEAEIGW